MQKTSAFKVSALSAAVASTLLAGPTTAQEAALEEVIVTASRRAQSIQDIPINITALSGDEIERQRLTDLSDISRIVPGMTVVDQGPRSSQTLTFRGLNVSPITSTDQTNDGGGTVATYVGEIPLYVDLKLNDMERVEVLMGPQGTLYGAGTLGGAVRYIPNQPQSDALSYQLRGDVYDLSHSSDAGYEGGGTVNVPLLEDTLAFRASVDYLADPGFIDYNYLVREAGVSYPQPIPGIPASFDRDANLKEKTDANDEDTWSGRAALRYTGDWLDGTLSYYYQDQDIGARQVNHEDAYGTGQYEAAHRFLEPNERENELLALELVADLGFAELTSATGYSEYSEEGQRDQTDLLLNFDYGYELFPSFAAYTREDGEEDTFTQELRLVSTNEGPFSWIVGAFYNDFDLDAQSREYAPGYDQWAVDNPDLYDPDGPPPSFLRPDSLEYYETRHETRKEIAGFGELGYRITDAWQVTVGGRWFKYEVDAISGSDTPLFNTVFYGDPPDSINPELLSSDVDDDDAIYKINTSYDFNDDIMTFLTVSEGYRLGGLNQLAPCPDPIPSGPIVCTLPDEVSYKPDKTINYEIGVHSQFSDALILNSSIFFIEWDDVQLDAITVYGDYPIFANGEGAESWGTELSGQYFFMPNFSVSASYSYNNAQLTEDAPNLFAPDIDAYSGDRLPGTPKHQGYLAAHYEMPLSDGSQLAFDWSMSAQSNVLTKVGNRDFGEKMSGFVLNNLSASWFKDEWTVSLYADNVFDEYAQTGVRSDTSWVREAGLFDLRRYYHNMVRPRQVGLQFIYNFED